MVKSIIKKVIIIVSVMTIMSFLNSKFDIGFILPVFAESGGGGGASLVQEKPEPLIGVDTTSGSSTTINEMHGLYSNAFIEGAYEYPEFFMFQYGILSSQCNESSGLCPLAYTPSPGYHGNQLYNNIFSLNSSDTSGVYTYASNIKVDFDDSIKIKNGNHYSLLIEFTRTSGITFLTHTPNLSLSTLNVSSDVSSPLIDATSNLSNVNIVWNRFTSDDRSTNWAYLLVEFDVDNIDLNNIYLQELYLTFPDGDNPTNVQPLPLNYLMFANGSSTHEYDVDVYFIENGDIQFNGWNCDFSTSTNSCYFSDNYLLPDYDYTYSSDIAVFDNLPVCSDTDIICHIKQAFEMIKAFFVRVSNYFRDLLAPNGNVTIAQQYFDTFHLDDGGLSSVITAPLNVIEHLDVESCSPITLSLLNTPIVLPCMSSTFYEVYFPQVFNIYQLVLTGLVTYYCFLHIFKIIRGLQSPDYDKVEEVDL